MLSYQRTCQNGETTGAPTLEKTKYQDVKQNAELRVTRTRLAPTLMP